MKWFEAMRKFYSAMRTDEHKLKEGIWAAEVTGYAQALLQLSFDVFSLRQVGHLTESVIARLRDNKEFQGVRYEIAVAAIFARAGFASPSVSLCMARRFASSSHTIHREQASRWKQRVGADRASSTKSGSRPKRHEPI